MVKTVISRQISGLRDNERYKKLASSSSGDRA
jgi:hypothetical protein